MEADFSKQISKFFAEQGEAVVDHGDLSEKLESIIAKFDGSLSLACLRAVYRRGSASYDHVHFPGVSRMQIGIARVMHVVLKASRNETCRELDFDLIQNAPAFYNEHPCDVFVKYNDVTLALAKVKLAEANIDPLHRDIHIALDDEDCSNKK